MLPDDIRSVSERLADSSLSEEDRGLLYAMLRGFNEQLRLRDLKRRQELVRFSNGLEMPAWKIAEFCHKYSLADFCIVHALTRAEVLERTGMAKAGVQ